MRRAPFLAVLLVAFPLLAAGSALAQAEESSSVPDHVTVDVEVYLLDSGCGGGQTFCIEFAPGVSTVSLPPNAQVNFIVTNIGGSPHDLTFSTMDATPVSEEDIRPREDDGSDAIRTPLLNAGESYTLSVILPDAGTLKFVCSVAGHEGLGMLGDVQVGGAAGGHGGEEKHIEEYGVDYWAYWVGIISFVILFIVLFVLYFVFRYGETKEAVDHRTGVTAKAAASGHAHAQDNSMWMALLVGVIFTLILIIAVILGGGGA